MPQKEIEKLDDDVMQFIVDDLKSGGKHFEYINSNIENQISILSSETLTGVNRSAFKKRCEKESSLKARNRISSGR